MALKSEDRTVAKNVYRDGSQFSIVARLAAAAHVIWKGLSQDIYKRVV